MKYKMDNTQILYKFVEYVIIIGEMFHNLDVRIFARYLFIFIRRQNTFKTKYFLIEVFTMPSIRLRKDAWFNKLKSQHPAKTQPKSLK